MAVYAALAIVALNGILRAIVLLFALKKAKQEDIPAIICASNRTPAHDAAAPMNEKASKNNGI